MKRSTTPNYFKIFFAVLLVGGAIFLDHSLLGWALKQPLVELLAKKTGRSLPQVTAVILPLSDGMLAPQDVALTLRACRSFGPKMILVTEPLGDFTNGPFSLIREGMETGAVAGIPFHYEPNFFSHTVSIWKGSIPSRVLSLDDFLLKREEMERGDIRPELDLFFRNQTVAIGGPNVVVEAKEVQSQQEKAAVHSVGIIVYGLLFLVITIGIFSASSLMPLDFALALLLFFVAYGAAVFFLFRIQGILLPLFLPIALLVSSQIFRAIGVSSVIRTIWCHSS